VPWLSELYFALTGLEVSPRDFLKVGERVFNLEKLMNAREGFTRRDDEIPAVWLKNIETPIKMSSGDAYLRDWFGNRVTKADIEKMLDDYYEERGWNIETGTPKREKLEELGLVD
jgi:aldehyde:ferredoxin oxidoreductase